MDSAELDNLRKARMSELQGNHGGSAQNPGGNSEELQAQQQQQDEMRSSMLSQVLEPSARERLARVALVRPDRARQVEEYISRLAQSGQLRQKIGERELVSLLDQVAQQQQQHQRVVFNRRTDHNSDDELSLDDSQSNKTSGQTGTNEGGDDEDDDFFD